MIRGVNLLVVLQSLPWGPSAQHRTMSCCQHCCRCTAGKEVPDPSCPGGIIMTTLDTSWFVLFVSEGLVFVQGVHTELSVPR